MPKKQHAMPHKGLPLIVAARICIRLDLRVVCEEQLDEAGHVALARR